MSPQRNPWPSLDYRPPTGSPLRSEVGIGVVGAGGIVQWGHLPAYRQAGYRVLALAARRREQLEPLAAEFGVRACYTDYRQMLADKRIQVVDVAVPGAARREVVAAAARAGKHVLVQKPLADSLQEARELVDICEAHGVLLAENHNARWAPAYRAVHALIAGGVLGQVFDVVHEMRDSQDWAPFFRDGWFAQVPCFQILQYAIHHIDLMALWFGRGPERVLAHTARKPGQFSRGEMLSTIVLDYGADGTATLLDRNAGCPTAPGYNRFTVEGSAGMCEGEARSSQLRVRLMKEPGRVWRPRLRGSWFPGSFAATMGNLLDAVCGEASVEVTGAANLANLAVVEAAYLSAEQGRAVALSEVT